MEHWAIIKAEYLTNPTLVMIDKHNPGTIYWGGNRSHMTNAIYEILKETFIDGDINKREKTINELWLCLYREYYKLEPATEPKQSEGWIAPNGKVYYCRWGEHREMAQILMAKYYNELSGEKELENKKWLKLYYEGLVVRGDYEYKCTQAQIDTMAWLCTATGASDEWVEELKDLIEMFEVE